VFPCARKLHRPSYGRAGRLNGAARGTATTPRDETEAFILAREGARPGKHLSGIGGTDYTKFYTLRPEAFINRECRDGLASGHNPRMGFS
jgi:hypothetical protein